MTTTDFYDIGKLGRALIAFEKAMANYRAIIEGRETIAKGMRSKYPNMKIDAIRSQMATQEEQFFMAAQVEYDDAKCCACSLGIELPTIDVKKDVLNILRLRKKYVELKNINV